MSRPTEEYCSERCSSAPEKKSAERRCGDDRSGTFVCQRRYAPAAQAAISTKVAALDKRVAVISDVHANRHALEAVLAAIDGDSPDEIWCLGDLVGYGPKPNECCSLVAARADVCLAGNHDLVVLGTLEIADFAGDAAAAARWTRTVLDERSRGFLERLEATGRADGAAPFHGSARDPVWEYVLSEESAWWTFQAASEPLVRVGHSHVPPA